MPPSEDSLGNEDGYADENGTAMFAAPPFDRAAKATSDQTFVRVDSSRGGRSYLVGSNELTMIEQW
jgi:hypothetical protein